MFSPKWKNEVEVWKHGAGTSQRKRSKVASEGARRGYIVVASGFTSMTFQKQR